MQAPLRQSGMALQFLEFDLSEDSDGWLSASALACPAAAHTPALIAEVQRLLQSLHAELGEPGALDEGHGWDLDLQVEAVDGAPLLWPRVVDAPPAARISLSLHLAGGPALRARLDGEMNT